MHENKNIFKLANHQLVKKNYSVTLEYVPTLPRTSGKIIQIHKMEKSETFYNST